MQSDLQNLEITAGELKNITGVNPSNILRPTFTHQVKTPVKLLIFLGTSLRNLAMNKTFSTTSAKSSNVPVDWVLNASFIIVALTWIVSILFNSIFGFLFAWIPFFGGLVILAISVFSACYLYCLWLKNNLSQNASLSRLLEEVDKFNQVVKAIHVNDQLEEVTRNENALFDNSDREKVIQSMAFTKEDLIKALKLDKIFRENQEIINTNPEIFMTNLSAVSSLEMSNQGSEYGKFLKESLEVAVSLQSELRNMQKHTK